MARQPTKVRVHGPYFEPDRGRWRVVLVDSRSRTNHFYETEKEANQVTRSLARKYSENADRTIDNALDAYEVWMRDVQNGKGNKASSAATTATRLRALFKGALDMPLERLTEARCAATYDRYRTTPTRTGKPPAVATHRGVRSEAVTFFGWCAKRKWIKTNPMANVEGVGKPKHGKPQLRITESRTWLKAALRHADTDPAGATAAMLTLLLGLRASEIVSRVVRDVDDDGRVLWIPDSKTDAGKRTLEVPEILVPLLARLAHGRAPHEPLFGRHWRDWPRVCVQTICRIAKVPAVTAHGMRGAHATLATERGITGHVVAQALGHESVTTTYQSYATPAAVHQAKQRKVIEVLDLSSRLGNNS
jgi:integrase